jgi:hypothetical protein
MTRPLSDGQLATLKGLAVRGALVVPGRPAHRLIKRGYLTCLDPNGADGKGSFAVITPKGLRALADAAEAGRIKLLTLEDFKPPAPAPDHIADAGKMIPEGDAT